MIDFGGRLYKQKRDLIVYFALTYVDKAITFALPLFILFILKDRPLYNLIEVVFSYAVLAMTLIELGLSNYLFWGYKNSEKKEAFLEKAQTFFKFMIIIYCSLSLVFFGSFHDHSNLFLLAMVSIRTLFTFYTSFYANVYRLQDRPKRIYSITISSNLMSLVLLIVAFFASRNYAAQFFFLPSAALLAWCMASFFLFDLKKFQIGKFLPFIKDSLHYSWPIVLNTLFMSFVNNYSKIYAYSYLSPEEMTQISYVLRVGLVIQLTHAAFASFYSKSIFMDESHKFNLKLFKQYSFVLLLSMAGVAFIIVLTNLFFSTLFNIPLTLSTALFVVYILLWCYIGYLEIYYGAKNANRLMLYYSIFSSALYILMIRWSDHLGLVQLSLFMFLSALVNLGLVIIGLKKLSVI